LSLPNGGIRENVIHTKVFQKYIGENVAAWFNWSKDKGLPVESMEDLVFVYGCTLVTSWAAAAFDDHTGNAELSLVSRTLGNGGAGFIWSNIRGTVEYHDSQLNSVCSLLVRLTCSALTYFPCLPKKDNPYLPRNRCAFIKCLRARHVLFWRICYYRDEASGLLSLDESSHDTRSLDEASHDARSHDESSHDTLSSSHEALFHASAVPLPYDSNSSRDSVLQSTGVPDDPEVGRLVRGDKKEA